MDEELINFMKEKRANKFGVLKKARKRTFRERDKKLLEVLTKWNKGKILLNKGSNMHRDVCEFLKEVRSAYRPCFQNDVICNN